MCIRDSLYSSVIKSEFMGSLNGGGHVVTINLPMLYSLKAGGYIGNVVFLNNDDDWTICDAEGEMCIRDSHKKPCFKGCCKRL